MKPLFKKYQFRQYEHPANLCPITIVTPDDGLYLHTFFDVDPISPTGRYLACLRLPFDDHLPGYQDEAAVCIIDLQEQSIAEVYRTKGWGLCVGAHVCWGPTDDRLYFNDKQGDQVFSVEYDLTTGSSRRLCHEIYQVTKDGRYGFAPNLAIMNSAQKGYGVVLDESRYNIQPSCSIDDQEGLWRLDIHSNTKKLILTKQDVYSLLPDKEPFAGCRMVFFHTKISPDQTRILQVIRCSNSSSVDETGRSGQLRFIVTCGLNGEDPKLALPYEFWIGDSHHPDWYPDSKHITMNLRLNSVLRFYRFRQDGTSLRMIFPHLHGSGHPSTSSDFRYFLTDAYPYEPFTNEAGEVPLRLIDADSGKERALTYIWTLSADTPFDLRCDPHPVWSHQNRAVVFNGVIDGKRQILAADMRQLCGY